MNYITTVDNPWNPFTHWDEWRQFDIFKGYNTCERLARIALVSDVLPDTINREALNEAYELMIKDGAFDKDGNFVKYKLVSKEESNKKEVK